MAALLAVVLVPWLAGCQDDVPYDLRAGEATYRGTDSTLAVRLLPPTQVMDRDGVRREAYLLELRPTWLSRFDGDQGRDLYAIDGAGVVVVKQWGCVMVGKTCHQGPVSDWRMRGDLAPGGMFWPLVFAGDGPLWLDGARYDFEVQRSVSAGHEVLEVKAPRDFPWSMANETRVTYDGSVFPLRIETRKSTGEWHLDMERVDQDLGERLAAIDAWPSQDVAPATGREPRLFPGDDKPVLDAAFSAAEALDTVLAGSAEARDQLSSGCLVRFSYPHSGGGSGSTTVGPIPVTGSARVDASIGILDGEGVIHHWVVRHESEHILGVPTKGTLVLEREDVGARDSDPGYTCADVQASPRASMTAQAFLDKVAALAGTESEPDMEIFVYEVRRPYGSSRPAGMGWGEYASYSMPAGEQGGMLWPAVMDAANGWWTWVGLPGGGMDVFRADSAWWKGVS